MNIIHLYEELNAVNRAFLQKLNNYDRDLLNRIPFTGSWTAAQVGEHIRKSDESIAACLLLPGEICNRDPFERVDEMRDIFLDYSLKMKSPAFVDPGHVIKDIHQLTQELDLAFGRIYSASARENLLMALHHEAFGEITKIEMMYFVIYHTRRHIHQLEIIDASFKNIQTHFFKTGKSNI